MQNGESEIFQDDIASRYSAKRPSPPATTWKDREQQIAKDITANGDDSVSSFVYNFDKQYVSNITSLVRARKFAEAKSAYDQLCADIEANREDIHKLTMIGDIGGPVSKELATRAFKVFNYDFDKTQIDMSDGTSAALGSILSDGSSYLGDKTRDLNAMGFGDAAAGMYMTGDDLQRKTLGSIIDPFVKDNGRNPGPNRRQMVQLADDVANNWESYVAAFGNDLSSVTDFVRTTHQTAGNAIPTMKALAKAAMSMNPDGTADTREMSVKLTSGYSGLVNKVFANKDGGDPTVITDSQRRMFDAVFVPAVDEMVKRTGAVDFDDPRFAANIRRIHDVNARLAADDVDLMKVSRNTGHNINQDFASSVADAMTGVESPSNFLSSVENLYGYLDSSITGGRDFATRKFDLTADPGAYLNDISRANGGKSSIPAADTVARGVKGYLVRSLTQGMASGTRADDVLQTILDDDSRRDSFMSGLVDTISQSFHGRGRTLASSVVANAVVTNFMSGRPTCIEDIVANMILDPKLASSSDPQDRAAFESLNMWYNGNVSNAVAFGPSLERVKANAKRNGLNDVSANNIASRAAQMMATVRSRGGDPSVVEQSFCKNGRALIPVHDDKGNLLGFEDFVGDLQNKSFIDPFTGQAVPPGLYNSDPEAWDLLQKRFKAEDDKMTKRQEEARRIQIQVDREARQQERYEKNFQLREEARRRREAEDL